MQSNSNAPVVYPKQWINFTKVDWYDVLAKFGIDEKYIDPRSNKHGECPFCSGSKRLQRYRFSNKKGYGEWFCSHCGGGNALTFLRKFTGRCDAEILSDIVKFAGEAVLEKDSSPIVRQPAEMTPEESAKNEKILRAVWKKTAALTAKDPVSMYLTNRVPGIQLARISSSIRVHFRLKYKEEISKDVYKLLGTYPGMVAKAVDSKGKGITLHRTYLTRSGEKAPVPKAKKQMAGVRKLNGAAIRIVEDTGTRILLAGEGIETMIGVATAYSYKHDTWSLLNARNLSVADIPRDKYDQVIIFADHDKIDTQTGVRPGTDAANKLMDKLLKEGFSVEVRVPVEEETDFLDVWIQYYKAKKKKYAA